MPLTVMASLSWKICQSRYKYTGIPLTHNMYLIYIYILCKYTASENLSRMQGGSQYGVKVT